LAETNCVFALANAIELLKLGLVDTLHRYMLDFCRISLVVVPQPEIMLTYLAREIKLNGLDTNILGTRRHSEGGEVGKMCREWISVYGIWIEIFKDSRMY